MKKLKKIFAAIICAAVTISMCACGKAPAPQPTPEPEPTATAVNSTSAFSVKFLDVGQGDAALVECDGHYMLIDGGKKNDSRLMYTILKEAEIEKLDYIFATSVAADHIGGLAGALNYATADSVFCAVDSYKSEEFEDFKKYADKNGGGIEIPMENSFYRLGSADIEIVNVDKSAANIVLKIIYGNTSLLFTGDMTAEKEAELIEKDAAITSTVLKAANYGGSQSSSADFLRRVAPKYTVVSVGKENDKGYPNKDLLTLLDFASVGLFRTDMHGDITCTSDGENLQFRTEKAADAAKIYNEGTAAEIAPPKVTPQPTKQPEATAAPAETAKPTPAATAAPTAEPTPKPTPKSTPEPTPKPTPAPTAKPAEAKPGKQPALESPFSVDELYEANLMTVITANHNTAQTESYFMGTTYYDGTFLVDDSIAKLNTYIYDSGAASYNGWYKGYTFYVNHMGRPVQTVYVEAFDGDQYYPYQMDLATYFMNHDEVKFKGKKGNDYIYQINSYPSEYNVTVDGSTKVIKEIEFGGEKVVYTYGQRVPGQDLLDAWYGDLKGIYVSADIYDGGQMQHFERMFYIPSNWELEVSSLGADVNVYLNKNYTVPYIYPGDGVSCELYVTNAMG
ncbi:MAG: MBL fold metallo-hydrolase [Oscillospiraceae bacterium]|nr:MBL fold metallo-hydrolase [Oscillospiraceae bacterium]